RGKEGTREEGTGSGTGSGKGTVKKKDPSPPAPLPPKRRERGARASASLLARRPRRGQHRWFLRLGHRRRRHGARPFAVEDAVVLPRRWRAAMTAREREELFEIRDVRDLIGLHAEEIVRLQQPGQIHHRLPQAAQRRQIRRHALREILLRDDNVIERRRR